MKEYVTWSDMEEYVSEVALNVKDLGMKGIFTFPRGGLILAALLSYKTELPILMAPCDNCIIIDDICDTGITMKKYSDLKDEKNYYLTTFYIQEDQLRGEAYYQCRIDYSKRIKHDNWIVFPWEND